MGWDCVSIPKVTIARTQGSENGEEVAIPVRARRAGREENKQGANRRGGAGDGRSTAVVEPRVLERR